MRHSRLELLARFLADMQLMAVERGLIRICWGGSAFYLGPDSMWRWRRRQVAAAP